jgi:hypothetical protein
VSVVVDGMVKCNFYVPSWTFDIVAEELVGLVAFRKRFVMTYNTDAPDNYVFVHFNKDEFILHRLCGITTESFLITKDDIEGLAGKLLTASVYNDKFGDV